VLTSIKEDIVTDVFSLWPNPSNGTVNIAFNSSSNDDVAIRLYDISGRLVDTQLFENNSGAFNQEVRFNNVKNAMYILSIHSGDTHIHKRLIIK